MELASESQLHFIVVHVRVERIALTNQARPPIPRSYVKTIRSLIAFRRVTECGSHKS